MRHLEVNATMYTNHSEICTFSNGIKQLWASDWFSREKMKAYVLKSLNLNHSPIDCDGFTVEEKGFGKVTNKLV